jgi:hypothetical protein
MDAPPTSADLYVSRGLAKERSGCALALPGSIEFAPSGTTLSASEERQLDRWAACLATFELEDATIVLLGGEPSEKHGLFAWRAARVREELEIRGIDPRRVVIGGPNVDRSGAPFVTTDSVRLEVSWSASLRNLAQRRPRTVGAR